MQPAGYLQRLPPLKYIVAYTFTSRVKSQHSSRWCLQYRASFHGAQLGPPCGAACTYGVQPVCDVRGACGAGSAACTFAFFGKTLSFNITAFSSSGMIFFFSWWEDLDGYKRLTFFFCRISILKIEYSVWILKCGKKIDILFSKIV